MIVLWFVLALAGAALIVTALAYGIRRRRGWAIGLGVAGVVAIGALAVVLFRPPAPDVTVSPAQLGGPRFELGVPATKSLYQGAVALFDARADWDQLYAAIERAHPGAVRDGDELRLLAGNQVYRVAPAAAGSGYQYVVAADTVAVTMSPDWTLDIVFPLPASSEGAATARPTFATTASAADLAAYYRPFPDAAITDGGARIHIAQNGGYTLTLRDGLITVAPDPGASPSPAAGP